LPLTAGQTTRNHQSKGANPIASARRHAGAIAKLTGATWEKAISHERLIVRSLQITVNLLAALLTFLALERF